MNASLTLRVVTGAAFLLGLLVGRALPLTPAQAVQAALVEAQRNPDAARQLRYLVLTGASVEERQKQVMAVSLLVNSVSRSRVITAPAIVDAQAELVRIDLAAYTDFRQPQAYADLVAAWERLAESDPYWHIRAQVSDGRQLKEVTTDGGWVGLEQAAKLRELSGSIGAVLRADYFVARVGGANYYEWAGIPAKESEFFAAFGVNVDSISRKSADTAANLLRSGVTRKPRRIIERPGELGSMFQTKDVDAESPDRDPIRNPVDFREQRFAFQASEFFAMGANQLWRVALYDAAGNRADAVPDKVAKDFTGDGIIRPLVTCLRCHELNGGASGLQPFSDDQHALMRAGAGSYLPEVTQKLAELYDPYRLAKSMARSREDFEAAVGQATGGATPKAATAALVAIYAGYLDEQVTPAIAAAELGVPAGKLHEVLAATTDPISLAIAMGKSVNRAAWESCFHDAATRAEAWRGKP